MSKKPKKAIGVIIETELHRNSSTDQWYALLTVACPYIRQGDVFFKKKYNFESGEDIMNRDLIAMMELVNTHATNITILKGVVVEVLYVEGSDSEAVITILDKLIL